MGYVANKRDRWYAVGYKDIDPVTGRDQRGGIPPPTGCPPDSSPSPCPPHQAAPRVA